MTQTFPPNENDVVSVKINLPEPKQRRIVKAAHPKTAAVSPSTSATDLRLDAAAAQLQADRAEDNGTNHNNHHSKHLSQKIADSPSVARELEYEKRELLQRQALKSATDRQKERREKKQQERRNKAKNPQSPPAGTGGGGVGDVSSGSETEGGGSTGGIGIASRRANPPVKANPFSRFLSVFSVEPQHPEHKRAHRVVEDHPSKPKGGTSMSAAAAATGASPDEEDDPNAVPEPLGKKMRRDDSDSQVGDAAASPSRESGAKDAPDNNTSGMTCPFGMVSSFLTKHPSSVVVTGAVLTAAFAVYVAFRWTTGGSKKVTY